MISRKNLIIALGVLSLGLSGCEETDADKIGDAQLCLDKATSATASACLDKIAGIETPAAYVVRCSAGFMEEGFTDAQRLIDAIEQLDAGGDGTTGLMSLMAFKSKSSGVLNKAFADQVYSDCEKSKQKSLTMMGALAKSATTFAAIAIPGLNSGTPVSANDIKDAIDDLLGTNGGSYTGDPTPVIQDIGSAVTTTYLTTCTSGSSSTSDLCTEMTNAINSAGVDINDPESVGNKILELWYASTGQ
ncbi:hypothetical protein [Bdellovibrio sp. HCB2-146]|uniref:hypothetical protein n=1 Tax=Bdellovibrio sp. HCB2-146 TaxID=3394362 RepID=UPI0039BD7F38